MALLIALICQSIQINIVRLFNLFSIKLWSKETLSQKMNSYCLVCDVLSILQLKQYRAKILQTLINTEENPFKMSFLCKHFEGAKREENFGLILHN